MRICILDGAIIKDKKMLHHTLADALDFPEWYGRNLDALYDCLTDIREETEIRIRNKSALAEHLGNYAAAFEKVVRRSAEENERIKWKDLQQHTGST